MRRTTTARFPLGVLAISCLITVSAAHAQRGPGPGPGNARDTSPIDLTGTWVAVVSEDWRHRMATPRVGDFESVPLNGAGRQAANAWDLEADNAAGLQCKAFGVGGIIRQPGRINISWEDGQTLRMDFDAGAQTRLLHFGGGVPLLDEPTWQGYSTAIWQRPPGGGRAGAAGAPRGGAGAVGSDEGVAAGGGGRGQRGGPPPSATIYDGGSLEVRTTGFREGYLRKNGVPYSEDAEITEYIHILPSQPGEDEWLLVVTTIEDPTYLSQPFYTSTQFKREPNDRAFNPQPCRTAPPPP